MRGGFQISMFIMAGSETTGQGVGSALYELGRNPAIQAKLRAEIMRFSQAPTFDELTSKMPYLDAVTRETCVPFFCPFQCLGCVANADGTCAQITLPSARAVHGPCPVPFPSSSRMH